MTLPSGIRNMSYEQDMAIFRTSLQWALLGVLLVILCVLPLFLSGFWLRFVCKMLIIIVTVQGLNIAVGYCGQISLAQAALMAVGGYTSAILVTKVGVPFWFSLPSAGIVCALIGLLFGLPAAKIKGMHLALATIALHFIVYWVISHPAVGLTGGDAGIRIPRPHLGPIDFAPDRNFYFVILFVTILVIFFTKNISRTRIGRAFIAIRDNEKAAQVMGVNLLTHKLLAFLACSFFGGIAGALWAHFGESIHPSDFELMDAIWFLAMLVVGGAGSTFGVIIGVVVLQLMEEFAIIIGPAISRIAPALTCDIGAAFGQIFFGLVVVLAVVYQPKGIIQGWEQLKSRFRQWPFAY